ncbi:3-oxoacyl-[acyl-carrier protein] reductase [Microbacterium sp. W4I4]|uniref:SDR family NAD(P)-dependent oxidoreductase n=1 Tax=Microbacterium sp. W4I4 TaxID=3042295 RepID=UPI00278B9E83|nr:SDR family oxidoreductase [Microbacterium sp. W4I4]MDQ0615442.1 3-oxoacyl-[acyl-carrier protein] reductase [Microbacterium sp. W4I4]
MTNALVTGASRGIGRAIAQALARRGDVVAVHFGSDAAAAQETLDSLPGSGHVLVRGDIADAAAAQTIVATAVSTLGSIDILVNNAAVAPNVGNRHPAVGTSYTEWQQAWRQMIDVNLVGAANITMLVAQHLIDQRRPGAVVNIGSRGAFRGEPDHPAYAASKAGLHAFGQTMAASLAPHGISVTSVAAGFIATERQTPKLTGPAGDSIRDQSPFHRVGTPEEVANAVLYLTSPEAVWASGAVLDLNGASHFRT